MPLGAAAGELARHDVADVAAHLHRGGRQTGNGDTLALGEGQVTDGEDRGYPSERQIRTHRQPAVRPA